MKYLQTTISKNNIVQKVENDNSEFLDCSDIMLSWKNALNLKKENLEIGLRNPRIWAIY